MFQEPAEFAGAPGRGAAAVVELTPVAWLPDRTVLGSLPIGASAHVTGVRVAGTLGDRLVELGFTQGASVTVLRRAPFGGPVQVRIRDYVLSVRREEAHGIDVAVVPGTGHA